MGIFTGVAAGIGHPAPDDGLRDDRQAIFDRFEAGDVETAATLIDAYLEQRPEDGAMLYNAACAQCRLGNLSHAEALLMKSLRAGFLNFAQMRRDPDLESLRSRPVFQAIMAARRAADAMLARRRIEEWTAQFEDRDYRYGVDETLRISYATRLDEVAHDRLQDQVRELADHLVSRFFETPLEHYVMIAIPDATDAQEIFDDPHIHGQYHHRRRQLVTTDVEGSLRHELVHAFHHHHMDQRGQDHPFWIQEGIASLYESCRIDGDGRLHVLPNDRDLHVRRLLERGAVVPWRTLFSLNASEFMAAPAEHYAHVRSILRYVADHGGVAEWYRAFVAGFNEDSTGIAALESVLDRSLNEIERDWQSWALRPASQPAVTSPTFVVDGHSFDLVVDPAVEAERRRTAGEYAAARALYEQGRFHAAIEALGVLIDRHMAHAEAHYTLALAYLRIDDRAAAQHHHAVLTGLDPSLASLVGNLLEDS